MIGFTKPGIWKERATGRWVCRTWRLDGLRRYTGRGATPMAAYKACMRAMHDD